MKRMSMLIIILVVLIGSSFVFADTYQSWENYPDSPSISSLYPYQYITTINSDGSAYLYQSNSPLYHRYYLSNYYVSYINSNSSYRRYNLVNNVWVFMDESIGLAGPTVNGMSLSATSIIELNSDIYHSVDMSGVWLAKTTPNDPVAHSTIINSTTSYVWTNDSDTDAIVHAFTSGGYATLRTYATHDTNYYFWYEEQIAISGKEYTVRPGEEIRIIWIEGVDINITCTGVQVQDGEIVSGTEPALLDETGHITWLYPTSSPTVTVEPTILLKFTITEPRFGFWKPPTYNLNGAGEVYLMTMFNGANPSPGVTLISSNNTLTEIVRTYTYKMTLTENKINTFVLSQKNAFDILKTQSQMKITHKPFVPSVADPTVDAVTGQPEYTGSDVVNTVDSTLPDLQNGANLPNIPTQEQLDLSGITDNLMGWLNSSISWISAISITIGAIFSGLPIEFSGFILALLSITFVFAFLKVVRG